MGNHANERNILIAFNLLDGFAIFLIILVLLPPLFCKSVRRRIPWYSHMLSWLVVAIALLLMVGHQRDPNPPSGLCFVQSALLYGAPPLTAFSMTCYLLDINLAITHLMSRKYLTRESKTGASILLAFFPWVIFLGVIIEVSIVFVVDKDKFHPPSGDKDFHLFCHYNGRIPNVITLTLVTIAALILISVKAWTLLFLFRRLRSYEWSNIKLSQMVLSAFIRTLVFTGLALVGIILGQISMVGHDPGWCLVLPLLPIIAALVYGVHEDVLRCAMFWRKKSDTEENHEGEESQPRDEEETVAVRKAETGDTTLRPAQEVRIAEASA